MSAASRRLAEPLADFCSTLDPGLAGMAGRALVQAPPTGPGASASRHRLPGDVALGYIGVVTGRIGAVITPPRISIKSTEKSFPAEAIAIEPAIVIAVEPAIVIAVKPTIVIAVETTAMRPGIGEIWLAESGSTQQSSCKDPGRPTYPAPCFLLVMGALHVFNIHRHSGSPFWLEWSQAEKKLGDPGYASISDRG